MFQLQLRDDNDDLIAYIDNKVKSISWDWDRIGGCGACNFNLKENFDSDLAGDLKEDYGVRAYLSGTLWYSGYIDRVTPNVTGKEETIGVSCLGYVNQLKRLIVREKTYSSQEISVTARNVAEVYATAYTSVVSSAGNYEDTGFSADTIYFNESVYDALSKLADIAGKREWGVDASKNLFFKARNDDTKHHFNMTEDFTSFKPIRDYNPIITKIYLEGSDDYSDTFEVTNRTALREAIVSNSAIKTQSVGYQYARMYLKEHGVAKRSFVGKQVQRTTRIESTVPIGRALIYVKKNVEYLYDVATQLYDSGLKYDGGNEYLQIEKVRYTLTDYGVNATLYLGPLPPSLSEQLARLEHEINTERITT